MKNLHYNHATYGAVNLYFILPPGEVLVGTTAQDRAGAASIFVPEHCKNLGVAQG